MTPRSPAAPDPAAGTTGVWSVQGSLYPWSKFQSNRNGVAGPPSTKDVPTSVEFPDQPDGTVNDILGYVAPSCAGTPLCRLAKVYRPGLSAIGSPSGRTASVALGLAVGAVLAATVGAAVDVGVGVWTTVTLSADAPQPVQASATATTAVAVTNALPSVFMSMDLHWAVVVLGSPNQGRAVWAGMTRAWAPLVRCSAWVSGRAVA